MSLEKTESRVENEFKCDWKFVSLRKRVNLEKRREQLRETGSPSAVLSRPVCGMRERTIIITLPGSPRAVEEILSAIGPVLPHAVKLLRDEPTSHKIVETESEGTREVQSDTRASRTNDSRVLKVNLYSFRVE